MIKSKIVGLLEMTVAGLDALRDDGATDVQQLQLQRDPAEPTQSVLEVVEISHFTPCLAVFPHILVNCI